ncbi:MAG: methylated-DNA--[protein]-cysteine S-methyltransferase [Spirochaetales bacterium]|nr:methylated-DNA--[protein]-cysteine S-methyltransferase [Spirochaetales bacterium]
MGLLGAWASTRALVRLDFLEDNASADSWPVPPMAAQILRATADQLHEYFQGKRKSFSLPLSPEGTTFQQKVWDTLLTIPFGQTISYSEEADRLGNREAIRAVARANGDNPIGIIIPCHRVIGKDGSLTGYAGGLWRKRYLLELEGVLKQSALPLPA